MGNQLATSTQTSDEDSARGNALMPGLAAPAPAWNRGRDRNAVMELQSGLGNARVSQAAQSGILDGQDLALPNQSALVSESGSDGPHPASQNDAVQSQSRTAEEGTVAQHENQVSRLASPDQEPITPDAETTAHEDGEVSEAAVGDELGEEEESATDEDEEEGEQDEESAELEFGEESNSRHGGDGEEPGGADADGGESGGASESADDALIDFELAEHERWAGSFGEMGTAGSDERAQFLLDQAGQGATSGAIGGASMGFVMGAIGAGVGQIAGRRLATLAVSRGFQATPVPGLGSAIGGVMAVAGLAMRDWGQTSETIGRIGTGEGYEGLANDLEGLAEILDVATQVMDVLAGVLGGIAVGMWVGAVVSLGTLSPLAASLSAIALGINLATTAIGLIINIVVRPTVTALRALHAFESQGDPAQIEAEGLQLQAAAGQITGAVAGAAAGRVGGAAGRRGGTRVDEGVTRLQASRTGGAPARTATAGPGPRVHVEVPEAPARVDVDAPGVAAVRPVSADAGGTSTPRPASTEGPVARSSNAADGSTSATHPPESFADLGDVVADLNASPQVAAMLTDTRAPLPTRATPWNRSTKQARRYANQQAAQHRAAAGMTGAEVQAGHTAAARHAHESGIREADWDTQPMMDLHSRRDRGLDVTVTTTDASGIARTRTRTRHTAQEIVIDDAVARSRDAQGQLTPQGQLDAARYTQWVAENTPWDQRNVDYIRNPPIDPTTRVILPPPDLSRSPQVSSTGSPSSGTSGSAGPVASSPARTGTTTGPSSMYASHTETVRTSDRSSAMAQYHAQVRSDPGRESGVWRGEDGTYYVMQGDSGSVAPPAAAGRLELIYHSHPTETTAAGRGLVTQPSQAGGDISVLQHQHGQGPPGRRQSSELHFPVYDAAGAHSGYGTTRFAYDPTHPLPLQVQTTLPGGRPSRQRYANFADFERRSQVGASGQTPEAAAANLARGEAQLSTDVAAARQQVETIAGATRTAPPGIPGVREGREFGRQMIQDEAQTGVDANRPQLGPAYTASFAGLQPGESIEIPINPAYPEPPGTTAELDLLLVRVAVTQEAQTELAGTEQAMATQAGQQMTHATQIGEAQAVTEELAGGRADHQSAADSTENTNTDQQTTAGEAISSLGRSAHEASVLATLVGSLRVFQGLAHLFSYLPGDLGRSAEGAKDDADELITSLNRVSETDTVQSDVEQGRTGMEANAERISTVSTEGQETDTEITEGTQQVVELQEANAESLAETQAVQQQATREQRGAAASENEAQSAHDNLQGQLQAWAQAHQQAREDAIQDAITQYSELGYQAREE
jgi:hypothetical protein